LLTDPLFYLLAIPGILLTGISKGGFGAGLGILAVPLISLALPPTQVAAIMLPILCVMDLFGIWAFRGKWDHTNMRIIMPAGILGILIGTLTFRYLQESYIRLLIGVIAVLFVFYRWFGRRLVTKTPGPNVWRGGFWGAVSGFVSFIAHAGGPPMSIYLLPQKLDKAVFVGTTVIFFMLMNYVKLIPYAWLGQFTAVNLWTALVLMPLAPIGIGIGVWLHRTIDEKWFYRISYLLLFIVGSKLVYDGVKQFM
jgi:uncharacterized membrane protein YfcA